MRRLFVSSRDWKSAWVGDSAPGSSSSLGACLVAGGRRYASAFIFHNSNPVTTFFLHYLFYVYKLISPYLLHYNSLIILSCGKRKGGEIRWRLMRHRRLVGGGKWKCIREMVLVDECTKFLTGWISWGGFTFFFLLYR